MSRRLSSVALALVLAVAVALPAAAARGRASTHDPLAAASGQIVWWSYNNTAFVAANKALIKGFEKQYPNIRVVYQ